MEDVERAINFIIEQLNISRESARRLLHRHICKGHCDWYKERGEVTGFASLTITERQAQVLRRAIEEFVEGGTIKDKFRRVHQYLCPGEPCSK